MTITNTGTGQTINLTSNSAGAFNAAALAPGNYKVQVAAKSFSTVDVPITVQVGNTATVNIKLDVGQEAPSSKCRLPRCRSTPSRRRARRPDLRAD